MSELQAKIGTWGGNADFIRELIARRASFLIVGGLAVVAHGCRDQREVDDLDILIDADLTNAECVGAALTQFGVSPFPASDLAKPRLQVSLKQSAMLYADILTPTADQDFGAMLARSRPATLNGMDVRVVGRDDLIAMKRSAIQQSEADADKHQRDLDCLLSAAAAHPA